MNRKVLITLALVITVLSCNKDGANVSPASDGSANGTTSQNNSSAPRYTGTSMAESTHPTTFTGGGEERSAAIAGSRFITTDVANQMINSYLYSMAHDHDYDEGTPAIKAYSIDADSLRAYLANGSIKNIKIMFGHTKDYIDAGFYGRYAGFRSGALTLIITGYDAAGHYVYLGGKVLDHAYPCPYSCAPGAAGSDILE